MCAKCFRKHITNPNVVNKISSVRLVIELTELDPMRQNDHVVS